VDVGIELRPEHHALVLERRPAVAWFEVPAETLLTRGDGWRAIELVAREYPLSLHAAGLSLASVTRLAATHLGHLREWVTRLQPDFVSHPLSWSAAEGAPLPDLVSIVRNVNCVQEILQRQILLENASKPLDLPDGAALILSVAKYYSPSGKAIQDASVTPNVLVADADDGAVDGDGGDDGNAASANDQETKPAKAPVDDQLNKAVEVLKSRSS